MIVTDQLPCKISLNTHGGCSIDFEKFTIWNRMDHKWAISIHGTPYPEPIPGYDTVGQAYVMACMATGQTEVMEIFAPMHPWYVAQPEPAVYEG